MFQGLGLRHTCSDTIRLTPRGLLRGWQPVSVPIPSSPSLWTATLQPRDHRQRRNLSLSAHPQHGAGRASLAGWRGQDGSRGEAPCGGTPGVHSTRTQTPSSVPKDRAPHSPLGHPQPHWDPDAPKHLSVRTGHAGVPLRELVDLLGGGSAMD